MRRDRAIRALVVRALTKPVNLIPAAAVIAVGLAFGIWWLLPAGVAYYAVMAITTFTSPAEARRFVAAGRAPTASAVPATASFDDPEISRRYEEAVAEEALIREAVRGSPMPVDEVEAELVGLKDELEALCARAQRMSDYLASIDVAELERRRVEVDRQLVGAPPELGETLARTRSALDDQLGTVEALSTQLRRFHAESLGIVSTLGAIRGQVVRASVADSGDAERRVRDQLGEARELVRVLTRELDVTSLEPGD